MMYIKNPILKTKVRNAFAKTNKDYTYTLTNININGSKRGCFGFIRNNANNRVVYINTEPSCASFIPPLMYRYAENEKDYKGKRNNFCKTLNELVKNVVEMLERPAESTF